EHQNKENTYHRRENEISHKPAVPASYFEVSKLRSEGFSIAIDIILKIHNYGQGCPKVHHEIKDNAGILNFNDIRKKCQMPTTADGKEFRQSLYDSINNGF